MLLCREIRKTVCGRKKSQGCCVRFIFMVCQLVLSSNEIRQFQQNQFWFNHFHLNAITESGNTCACENMSVVVFNLSVFHLA